MTKEDSMKNSQANALPSTANPSMYTMPLPAKGSPDMLTRIDLRGVMELAGKNLLACLDPTLNHLPIWNAAPEKDGSVKVGRCWFSHNLGRWWDALLRLESAHLADAFSAWVAPHCPMIPVITAISLHLDAAVPNFLIQERLYLNDWRNEVITEPLVVKDGFLTLNDKPGLGIELDEKLCAAHPEIPIEMPRLFRPDGAVCD